MTLACVSSIAVLPLVARGDDAPAPPVVPQSLLDAREEVAAINEFARSEAPLAVGAACGATLDVPGLGETCRTKDGLLRVETADGESATIHGLDAPPLGAASYSPTSTARVSGASRADIDCVASNQPHYVLVYARPNNVSSRYGSIAPKLRQEAFKMSAFLDAESQSVDPSAGRRLPFLCDSESPRVLDVTIPAVGGGGVVWEQLVSDLKATGLSFNDPTGNERYAVFVDAASSTGASGTGHVFANDSTPGAGNSNNRGGLYAVQYRYDGADAPVWSTMLHEIGHTMGAVINGAPNASGAGHCHDDQDVMCYQDGASPASDAAYRDGVCAVEVFDCKRDDYFNPAPAAGSYLATHWNVAGEANRWLNRRAAGDQSAPTSPSGLRQTGASNSAVGLAWGAASDDVGVTGYEISLTDGVGAVVASVTTSRLTAALTGLSPNASYTANVVALDARGNRSVPLSGPVATNDRADTTAPGKPANVKWAVSGKTVVVTWNDASDDVGVDAYNVVKITTAARTGRSIRSTPTPVRATTYTLPASALKPGVPIKLELRSKDTAGNLSAPVNVSVQIAKDKVKPTAPKLKSRNTASGAMLSWSKSVDAAGVTKYVLFYKSGARWVMDKRTKMGANVTKLNLRLTGRGKVTVRIGAFDAAGNVGYSRAITLKR